MWCFASCPASVFTYRASGSLYGSPLRGARQLLGSLLLRQRKWASKIDLSKVTQIKNKVRTWTQVSRLQPTALSTKPFVSLKRQVFTVVNSVEIWQGSYKIFDCNGAFPVWDMWVLPGVYKSIYRNGIWVVIMKFWICFCITLSFQMSSI